MNQNTDNKVLTGTQTIELLGILKARFEVNTNRHIDLIWSDIQAKLVVNPDKLWSLNQMEITTGEPDVVGLDKDTGQYIFYDCSKQTPKARVSLCYDSDALESRKTFKPRHSAVGLSQEMGVELLDQEQYKFLQTLGEFDTTTSSWLKTPQKVRALGGALFGDRRFDTVFVYHNGVESYYAARGFRVGLRV